MTVSNTTKLKLLSESNLTINNNSIIIYTMKKK